MDELDLTLPPELESALVNFYTGPEPDRAFVSRLDLELQQRYEIILQAPRNRKDSFMQALRARPALAILLVILALLLVSGVAYAIGRLTGFIPGFGFTTGDVYVLDMPIEASENGITAGVENAVQDETKIWVELSVHYPSERDNQSQAYILLQNGEKIQSQRGGVIIPDAGEQRLTFIFPALGDPSLLVTLILENSDGQTVQMKFNLRSAQSAEVLPILPGNKLPVQGETSAGMALVLESVAMSADQTVLQVSLHFDKPGISLAGPWDIVMTDDANRIYPLTDITPDTLDIGITRVYQTMPLHGHEGLILKLVSFPSDKEMPMLMDFSTNPATFTFNPGPNPQVGQSWSLDENLQTGQFTFHIVGARMTALTELTFEFEPTQNETGAMLYSTLASGASGGEPAQGDHFTASMSFTKMPNSPFEIQLMRVYYRATGPWQVQWQAPAATTLNFPTMTPAPSPTPLIIPALVSQDPILLEVEALSQKFDNTMTQDPTWIHVVNENITERLQPGQTYPPPYYQDEQWYEIDTEGWVIRNITTHRDVDGNILQQSASVGTKSINFTMGETFENSPYRLSFDLLTRDLDNALQRDQSVIREEIICDDGSRCLLITLWEQFAQPIQNPGEPQSFYGIGRRVWINLETGQQLKFQTFWRLADGTEQIELTQSNLLIQKVAAPPSDVLDILERIVMP